jgi:hypothetical protein
VVVVVSGIADDPDTGVDTANVSEDLADSLDTVDLSSLVASLFLLLLSRTDPYRSFCHPCSSNIQGTTKSVAPLIDWDGLDGCDRSELLLSVPLVEGGVAAPVAGVVGDA